LSEEFSIKILEEEPVIKKKYSGKKGLASSIIDRFLEQEGDYAEIKLTKERKARDVARALGRVISGNYKEKVKYLGRSDDKNVVYLKKV
jgi:hypothetical protein